MPPVLAHLVVSIVTAVFEQAWASDLRKSRCSINFLVSIKLIIEQHPLTNYSDNAQNILTAISTPLFAMMLTDLPAEILSSIFDLITVRDFLSLTRTCKQLYALQSDSVFWKRRVRSDFRIPPQPLLENDVKRWQRIYQLFSNHSTVFTWGNSTIGNSGRPREQGRLRAGWPDTMHGLGGVGHIADVQCGGWSTVLLSTTGKLWAAGVVDGTPPVWRNSRNADVSRLVEVKMPLRAERGWLFDVSHRSIREFSMGRQRLLALSDEGEIIEWTVSFAVAGDILTIDKQRADSKDKLDPTPVSIVAGWQHGSAYYAVEGLYYWTTISSEPEHTGSSVNKILHPSPSSDVKLIPGTRRPDDSSFREQTKYIGPLKTHLVLENHIIMLTTTGKLFLWNTADPAQDGYSLESHRPTELVNFYQATPGAELVDIQGSFRTFAVFSRDGSILTCALSTAAQWNTSIFDHRAVNAAPDLPSWNINPALQNADVIQLAFGDYHYHALHVNGEVTSYGRDSECCGALGLGQGGISFLRGVDWRPTNEGNLLLNPQGDGRRTIWFEPEKFSFLLSMLDKFMHEMRSGGIVKEMASRKTREFREVYGEWFEREGLAWKQGPLHAPDKEKTDAGLDNSDEGIAPYFALRIAAAGWSGAALVLVDEKKAEQVRNKYLLPEYQSPISQAETEETEGTARPESWSSWVGNVLDRIRRLPGDLYAPDQPAQNSESGEAKKYIWDSQQFPVLRVAGAEIDEGSLSRWRGGEPQWVKSSANNGGYRYGARQPGMTWRAHLADP